MFSIALYQPEIPPNTGNIIRLCANTGCALHLIGELGFSMDEKKMRRAGLDYHHLVELQHWQNWNAFKTETNNRIISLSTKNKKIYSDFAFKLGDVLLFGSETSGLPQSVREDIPQENRLTLPMQSNSRSLNLSNSVAIVLYEAWRQHGFATQ